MKFQQIRYTIRRCRKNDTLNGPSHASLSCSKTICGLFVASGAWWVTHNDFDGEITCKRCLALLSKGTK
jgi:hypothetical protein